MRIIKFRIENYKSIKDTGICYFDSKITILAGKNEAGKTAILEALEDLNLTKKIKPEAIPIYDKSLKPRITLWIKLESKDLNDIKEFSNSEIGNESLIFHYSKTYPDEISIELEDQAIGQKIIDYDISGSLDKIKKYVEDLKQILENFSPPDPIINNLTKLNTYLTQYSILYKTNIKEDMKLYAVEKIEYLKKYTQILNDYDNILVEIIKLDFIPNFILFTTFDDILPSESPITSAKITPILNDLSVISNLNFDIIQPNADPIEKEKHRERVNIKLNKEYKEFWTQDHSQLHISWDSNKLYFWVKEDGEYFPPKLRSKGKQWHLAFYIRISARTFKEKNNIILIDEPGLFLHAKAQKDILKKLEDSADNNQIIYCTHSPYLIPPKRLNRVRLVIKENENGTLIKELNAEADIETLTPIYTAIGEDLTAGIRADRKNSIIVEGYSDFLYLLAFKELLNIEEEFYFVPCVGVSKTVYVGCVLFGWGLNPIFLLDNDHAGDDAKEKLMKRLSIREDRILQIPFDREGTIEDLFVDDDSSIHIREKSNYKGKVISAKKFIQSVEDLSVTIDNLNEKTVENFQKIFEKLKTLLD